MSKFCSPFILLCAILSTSSFRTISKYTVSKWVQIPTLASPTLSSTLFSTSQGSVSGSVVDNSGAGTILLSNKACRTRIGIFDVIAEECEAATISDRDFTTPTTESNVIRLVDVGSGWGNGAHPTTKLCMNFIEKSIKKGDKLLDYGTGSGILSIAAAKLGAIHCIAVDIDEDTLIAAEINGRINGVANILDVVHTRHVYVGEERFPVSDVTVANILPGPLSMLAATLWSFTAPGGMICLSGMRPHELPAIRKIYSFFVDLSTEVTEHQSHEIYGDWVSWSGHTKVMSKEEVKATMNKLTEASMDR